MGRKLATSWGSSLLLVLGRCFRPQALQVFRAHIVQTGRLLGFEFAQLVRHLLPGEMSTFSDFTSRSRLHSRVWQLIPAYMRAKASALSRSSAAPQPGREEKPQPRREA